MMLLDISREIIKLVGDRKFVNNLSLVAIASMILACSLATVRTHPTRVLQQDKLERLSDLVSVGISIKTQIILK